MLSALPSGVGVDMDVKTVLDDARDPAGPAYVGSLGLDGSDVAHVIEVANQAGLEVMTWTATPLQAVRAAAIGIDAVCVDDIPGTLTALAAAGASQSRSA